MNKKEEILSTWTVYIDTSALMNNKNLENMVTNIENNQIQINKKIIVSRPVWAELLRHLDSTNEEKKNKASQAISTICLRRDIFKIEGEDLGYEEEMKAFADAEILARLTKNKRFCKQLLITNDSNLSKDAYQLNHQESCLGNPIQVCNLTKDGDLMMFELNDVEAQNDNVERTTEEKGKQETTNYTKFSLVTLLTMATGYIAGKYGKQIIKYVTTII